MPALSSATTHALPVPAKLLVGVGVDDASALSAL